MHADIISILNQYGNSTIEQIKQNLAGTGTNASGKTAQSLHYQVTNEGTRATLKILGKPYFMVVETGRKPTPDKKPSKDFVRNIKDWLQFTTGDTRPAYAIAMSINKKGTKLYQDGGRKDIVSNVINQNLTDKISLDLLNKFAEQVMSSVVKIFKDDKRFTTT